MESKKAWKAVTDAKKKQFGGGVSGIRVLRSNEGMREGYTVDLDLDHLLSLFFF